MSPERTILLMVGAIGFEPTTPCAQGRCATRLRYAPTLTTSSILNHFHKTRPLIGLNVRALVHNIGALRQVDIKQSQPVLQRLESESAQNEAYPKRSQPAFREVIGVVLDVRIDHDS